MPDFENIKKELQFKAVRSSGAGGQHVNKTSSKVILHFELINSQGLTPDEKELLNKKLATRLTNEGILILESGETRSQHKNKELVIERFEEIIINALRKPKPRKKTKPSRASKLKRLRNKKILSEKKGNRQKPEL